jgi:hypothetical protein
VIGILRAAYLHTLQVPPSLLQCLQYLQFLQALHVPVLLQVASSVQQSPAIFFSELPDA